MLTTVILEGPMGKEFGREWNIKVSSPRAALKLIDANSPGMFNWIRSNLERFSKYRVLCERHDGKVSELECDEYRNIVGSYKKITFAPITEGSGGAAKIVLGVVMIAVAFFNPAFSPLVLNMLYGVGGSMVLSGVAEMLTSKPTVNDKNETDENKTSYYFNGPVNTIAQGVPVQLIYGRVLVGSHVISASVSVDQLLG